MFVISAVISVQTLQQENSQAAQHGTHGLAEATLAGPYLLHDKTRQVIFKIQKCFLDVSGG